MAFKKISEMTTKEREAYIASNKARNQAALERSTGRTAPAGTEYNPYQALQNRQISGVTTPVSPYVPVGNPAPSMNNPSLNQRPATDITSTGAFGSSIGNVSTNLLAGSMNAPTKEELLSLASPSTFAAAVRASLQKFREESVAPLEKQRASLNALGTTATPRLLADMPGLWTKDYAGIRGVEQGAIDSGISELNRRIDDRNKTISETIDRQSAGASERIQLLLAQQQKDIENLDRAKQLQIEEKKLNMSKMQILAGLMGTTPQGQKIDVGALGKASGVEGLSGIIEGLKAPSASAGPGGGQIAYANGIAYTQNANGDWVPITQGAGAGQGMEITTGGASQGATDPSDLWVGYGVNQDGKSLIDASGKIIARITSPYGANHTHISGEKYHKGYDVVFDKGAVKSLTKGEVIKAGIDKAYGGYVWIKGEDGNVLQYGHLNIDNIQGLQDSLKKSSTGTLSVNTDLPFAYQETRKGKMGTASGPHTDIRMAPSKPDPFQTQFEAIMSNRFSSNQARDNARKIYEGAVKTGDPKVIQDTLDKIAVGVLTGEDKKVYSQANTIVDITNKVLSELPQPGTVNYDPWTNLLQKNITWAGVQKNPEWVKVAAPLGYAFAQLRHDLFGSALTAYEAQSGESFLLSSSDTLQSAIIKLENLKNIMPIIVKSKIANVQGRPTSNQPSGFTTEQLDGLINSYLNNPK